MKCDKKGSHRKCITIFIWISVWGDHSGKVKKTPKTFCSLSKLQNQTTLKNSLQVEKSHSPIVWNSCEEWSLFDSTSHPEDISGFNSTWSSLGPLIIHIDLIFIQCNGGQDRDACSTLWELQISTIETNVTACTKFSIPRDEILYPKMQKTSPTKYTNGLSQNGVWKCVCRQ